jgi:YfiR/HmsC-like
MPDVPPDSATGSSLAPLAVQPQMIANFAAVWSRTRRLSCAGLLTAVGAVLCLAGMPTPCAGQPSELQVKAAFVLNFLKFVEWPSDGPVDPSAPFVIVVIGDDPIGSSLRESTAGRTVGTHPLIVRTGARAADGATAQLVFIPQSERRQLPSILHALEGRLVLTVGDTPGYAESGVMLNLVVEDQRVRFEANTAAAARAGVHLSSHLLRIARIVG